MKTKEKKIKLAAVLSAAVMLSSVCLPAFAADTGDTPWHFDVTNSYSYTDPRPKDDATYVYVKVKFCNRREGAEIRTMGRPDGGGWENDTAAGVVYLKSGHIYSVQNFIYEKDDDQAALRGSAASGTTLDASGVWSPDSVGVFEIV